MLLYTYISRFSVTPHYIKSGRVAATNAVPQPFLIAVSTSRTNGPRLLSRVKAGTHSALANRIAHSGLHAETGNVSDGALSLPSIRAARSRISPGRVSERRTLPLWGLGRGCSQRTQRAFGTAMRLCASLSRGVAAPLGCVICLQLGDVAVFSLCAQYFLNVRGEGWYHYPQRALRAAETLDGRLSKRLSCHYWGAASFEVG